MPILQNVLHNTYLYNINFKSFKLKIFLSVKKGKFLADEKKKSDKKKNPIQNLLHIEL